MLRELQNGRGLTLLLLAATCLGCSTFGSKSSRSEAPRSPVGRLDSERRFENRAVSYESADNEQKKLGVADFAPRNLSKTVKRMAGAGPNESRAQETFRRAEAKYQEASALQGPPRTAAFLEAAELFGKAAEQFPESAIEHDSLYMLGASQFFADQYVAANEAYEKLLKKYPNSRMLDSAESHRYAIGEYWLKLQSEKPRSFWSMNFFDETRPFRDTQGNALRIFDKIRIDDPTGKLADDATMALANAQFRAGNYVMADATYTDLIKTFPDSEHQFDAHVLGIKAKLLSYQGADYSGDVLDQAEKLIKQVRLQFPHRAAEEMSYLQRGYAEVRYKKAEREWRTAQFYDRRREYGAARQYYRQLLEEYDDTPFRDKARQRLAALNGEPNVPAQRLSWLVDLFPKNEDVKPLIATAPASGTRR